MRNAQSRSRILHIIRWVAQVLLAAGLIFGSVMKLFQPIEELSALWPWTGQVPPVLVRLTGVLDLLGATGLILPSLLRIRPALTSVAAISVLALMLCAAVFHIARGEASAIGVNIFFAALAGFIYATLPPRQ